MAQYILPGDLATPHQLSLPLSDEWEEIISASSHTTTYVKVGCDPFLYQPIIQITVDHFTFSEPPYKTEDFRGFNSFIQKTYPELYDERTKSLLPYKFTKPTAEMAETPVGIVNLIGKTLVTPWFKTTPPAIISITGFGHDLYAEETLEIIKIITNTQPIKAIE